MLKVRRSQLHLSLWSVGRAGAATHQPHDLLAVLVDLGQLCHQVADGLHLRVSARRFSGIGASSITTSRSRS